MVSILPIHWFFTSTMGGRKKKEENRKAKEERGKGKMEGGGID